jgi:hypothetical protein
MPVDDDIPIPPPIIGQGKAQAMRTLTAVGQSVLIAGPQGIHHALAKRAGFRITTRKEGPNLYRVWRIS